MTDRRSAVGQWFVHGADEPLCSIVKVRDVIKMLENDGWSVVRQRGSHRQFKHSSKRGLVTVAGKPSDDLAPGTLNSVLKQAGLT